jgi:hypothetical protein
VVLDDNLFYVSKLVPGKSVIERDLDRFQPNLRLAVVPAHVDVHRLIAVKAHEKESIGTVTESSRHRGELEEWRAGSNLPRIIRFRI